MILIYGRRGTRGEASEDTLASSQCCLERGANRCELDLHLSCDGELMMIHDPTLKRTTGCRGKVVEYGAATLAIYDACEGGPGWVRPTPIPRSEELFGECPFEHWQPEVKNVSRERAVWTVTRIRKLTERFGNRDRVTVTSDSRTVLKALNELTPGLSLRLVTEYVWLDPLKVVQHYGCVLFALNWTLCTPERLLKA